MNNNLNQSTTQINLEQIFSYHKPSEEAIKVMQIIREEAQSLVRYILNKAGNTRETDKCLELIEQLSMYANASLSRHGLLGEVHLPSNTVSIVLDN
jgi:hypothetical protein